MLDSDWRRCQGLLTWGRRVAGLLVRLIVSGFLLLGRLGAADLLRGARVIQVIIKLGGGGSRQGIGPGGRTVAVDRSG
jgi:hypothetical protein